MTINNLNMNRNALLTLAFATSAIAASAQRSTINLKQWQFSRDSINYKAVTVPHDWAINGPFDKKWDLQYVAIEQNGERRRRRSRDARALCLG